MTANSVSANISRRLRPRQFSLGHLLFFWVMAVLLPAAAVFCLLNYSEQQLYEANKTRLIDSMLESYHNLQKACDDHEYFAEQIRNIENYAGLPGRDKSLIPDLASISEFPENLLRPLSRLKNFKLLLLVTSEANLETVKIFSNPQQTADSPRPGLRAARELMKEYRNLNGCVSETPEKRASSRKILKSVTTSIFGTYLNPLEADEDFTSGFSEKSGGNRMFTARRHIASADGRPLFSYIAIFHETDNHLAHSFNLAKRQLAEAGFTFRLKMQSAIPFPFVFENTDGSLRLSGPVQFRLLTTGFFKKRDILSSLIDRGIMQHRPALYPHFEITAAPHLFSRKLASIKPGFVIFLFMCLSLLMIKSFHQQGNVQVGIRTRLFLSVLLATALPSATLIFYMHRHVTRVFSKRQNQMSLKLKSHLRQLELAVKSADQKHYSGFLKFVDHMRKMACTASGTELKRLLDTGLDKTFSGVGLLRNDGLIIENLDSKKISVIKLEKKISLTREFTYASVIKFFQCMGLMPESLHKTLQGSSRGKKLLAMAEIFIPNDIDNFCSFEGNSQVSKQDFGNFRMMSYKILPPPIDNEKRGAVLLLIQDIRELAHQIINEFANNWSFFRQYSEEGLVETSIISSFNLDSTSLDFSTVWPPRKTLEKRHISIAQHLTQLRSEAELITEDTDGTPVIVVGRKIAGYPLIAISECRMAKLSQHKSVVAAVIGGNLLYILLLLSVLVSILSELFMPPIDRLLDAAKLTGEGTPVQINNSFSNELSHLTNEFNKMSQQIMERERLERFISREAAQTIASESRGNVEIASQKVDRTIVFIHIRHFSALNSLLAPEKLFELLNLFFPFVEEKIEACGGQIDKYIGDAIMAVFAASHDQQSEPAIRACQAVNGVRLGLADLNKQLIGSELPEIKIGTGVSSGVVISGRIGSYQGRLDYTVIGDRVNLAARLESASHFDETSHILIDEETWKLAKHLFSCRFHGEISIKGKTRPVKTYEIIA